ncbi:hypothetical protein [Clostridium thailandense]|uniref:hypothetical protein n=1 Tax=Clostridium thailandense TaxID=2794346 RepID=UPI003989125B
MQKKSRIAIIVSFILIAIIRSIGIEKMPIKFAIGFFTILIILMFFFVYRFKENKVERKYLLAMTVMITLIMIATMMLTITVDSYPQLSKQYKPVILIIISILYISLMGIAIANIIYKSKNNK